MIEGATSWREVVVERVVGDMAMVKIGREGGLYVGESMREIKSVRMCDDDMRGGLW